MSLLYSLIVDEKKFIDVDLVISECGIFSDIERNVVIKNIKNLATRYEKYELIQIYNQILVSSKEPDILMTTITCADAYKDESTLGPLVDLLLTKNQAIGNRALCF